MEKEALTLHEAAEFLGWKEQSLRNAMCRRMIPYYKSKTGRTYFNRDELKDFVFAVRVPSLAEEQSKAEVRSLQ